RSTAGPLRGVEENSDGEQCKPRNVLAIGAGGPAAERCPAREEDRSLSNAEAAAGVAVGDGCRIHADTRRQTRSDRGAAVGNGAEERGSEAYGPRGCGGTVPLGHPGSGSGRDVTGPGPSSL